MVKTVTVTAEELVEHIKATYSPNEAVAYYIIGHSELHEVAHVEKIQAECKAIDMALNALTFNIGRHFRFASNKPLVAAIRTAVDVLHILENGSEDVTLH